ncbi:hypothetical protein [Blastococcus sp. SYSU DS0973]
MELPAIVSRAGGALLSTLQHVRLPGVGQASVTDDPATAARRWRAVTVLKKPDQVGSAVSPPPPLDRFGDRLEVRILPAPVDKGTELAARFRDTPSDDEIGELRAALREAKQRLETGEVLRVDPQPHGHREPTPQGAALEGMTEQAPKEGVL